MIDGTHFYGDGCDAAHGRNKVCECCGDKVPSLEEYQQYQGRAWRGHESCVKTEAGKWVLVQRDDLAHLLEWPGARRHVGLDAWDRMLWALEKS